MTGTKKKRPTGSKTSTKIEFYVDGVGVVRPKGLNIAYAKGRTYFYHRASKTRLSGIIICADGRLHAPTDVLAEIDRLNRPQAAPSPGTVGALFAAWRGSRDFQSLAARTRKDYEEVMDWIAPINLAPGQKPRWRDRPLRLVTPGRVSDLVDKAYEKKKRRFANYVLSVLGSACRWAVLKDWMPTNPCREVPQIARPTDMEDANQPWSPEERRAFLRRLQARPQLLAPHVIGVLTGLREGDVVNLPLNAWDGETFKWKASKNGVERELSPPPEALQIALNEMIALRTKVEETGIVLPMYLCLNSRGHKWTVDGFRASYFKEIAQAIKAGELRPKRGFHSHRHGVGNALAEAGLSHAQIKTALGNKSAQSVEIYIARANKKKLSAAGVAVVNDTLGQEFDED